MPLHLQLLVKWEVVSPNSRYREFYHELGNIEKCPFTYWLNGRWFLQIVDVHVGNFDMKLTGRWFPQIVNRDSGNLYPIYIYITKIVVLVSEPVRGRSRVTELPCFRRSSLMGTTLRAAPSKNYAFSTINDHACIAMPT